MGFVHDATRAGQRPGENAPENLDDEVHRRQVIVVEQGAIERHPTQARLAFDSRIRHRLRELDSGLRAYRC
jgi:hypothetical protein